jgi:hypothetical protein
MIIGGQRQRPAYGAHVDGRRGTSAGLALASAGVRVPEGVTVLHVAQNAIAINR